MSWGTHKYDNFSFSDALIPELSYALTTLLRVGLRVRQFHNHAQNKFRVSLGGPTRFVNMAEWVKKIKRLTISKIKDDKTEKNVTEWCM